MMPLDDEIATICARILAKAKREKDADAIGELIERLARAIGFTVAVAVNGDPRGIDTMIKGVEGYAFEEATAKARVAARMAIFMGEE